MSREKGAEVTPKIVSTPNTLSGTPRIDGHRIGVCHILANAREAIVAATKVNFPQLEEAEVNAAIDYAIERCESAPSREAVRSQIKCDGCGYPVELPNELCEECKEDYLSGNLRPCPFCGGQASMKDNEDGANFVECGQCGASTNLQYSLKDDGRPQLYERWNTRIERSAPPAQTPTALAHSSFLSNGICRCACNPHCGCECHKLTNSTPEAPPAQTPRWISVKERLPEVPEYYLVAVSGLCDDGENHTDEFAAKWDNGWHELEGWGSSEVTHWMPLPLAPEAEVKTEWATCPKCHQPVSGPHECYESVLNAAFEVSEQFDPDFCVCHPDFCVCDRRVAEATPQPDRCPHECGIDGNHKICKCALCGLTKPITESWCYQTAAEKENQ